MNAIKGFVKNGRIEVATPADWPEGTKVLLWPVGPAAEQAPNESALIPGMTEDEQGDDPESIARWLAEFDAIPPLPMSAEEEADWLAWRKQVKDYNVEAVRRQMEEGIP